MSIFGKTVKLGFSVIGLPFGIAKDVVSMGFWNTGKESICPGSTITPFATFDSVAKAVKATVELTNEIEKATDK